MTRSFKRLLVIASSTMALTLALAPVAVAGEDDDEDESGGGAPAIVESGGDSTVPVGGVQTGVGGTWVASGPTLVTAALGGSGLLILAGAGGLAASGRRQGR